MIQGKLISNSKGIAERIEFVSFSRALSFVLSLVDRSGIQAGKILSFSVEFDSLNLIYQSIPDGNLLQIFLSDEIAADGVEGWRTLVQRPRMTMEELELNREIVFLEFDIEECGVDGYFKVLEAEGVWFSRDLLTSNERTIKGLKELVNAVNTNKYLLSEYWINLGII